MIFNPKEKHETRDFAKYKAFWNDARITDKMQWEKNRRDNSMKNVIYEEG